MSKGSSPYKGLTWKNCHVQRTRPSSFSCSSPWHLLVPEFLVKLPQRAAVRAVRCLLRVEPPGTSPTLITCVEFISLDSQMLGEASAFDRSFPAFFTLAGSFREATKLGFLALTTVTPFSQLGFSRVLKAGSAEHRLSHSVVSPVLEDLNSR